MANQKDIRRRIQSVDSIMQITNAMQLVASAKLRKIRTRLENTKPYFDTVYQNINEILGSVTETTALMEERPVKNRAVIVIASDKGLAGGYNNNVVKEALETIQSDPEVNTKVFTTGIRSLGLFRRNGIKANIDFSHISKEPLAEDASVMGEYFTRAFIDKEFDEVYLVYTEFKSMMSFEPKTVKLLPASGFDNHKTKEDHSLNVEYEFEPSAHSVLTRMIKQYINVTVYSAILESAVSEQASRSNAMESATTNGEELVEELELLYNRARQAAITQEITEIVGGAEALN